MSAYIDFIKEKGSFIYPITLTNAIYNIEGNNLDTILEEKANINHNHDNIYAKLISPTFKGATYFGMGKSEGGEIVLLPTDISTNINGITLDNCNGTFRIFGYPSNDKTTFTDGGAPLYFNPYTQKIYSSKTWEFSGIAGAANRLCNPRNIAISGAVTGSANFDGSSNISISTSVNHTHNYPGSSSAGGAANSAAKLTTARNIAITGAVTGNANFDGSGNISISTSVNHTHTYIDNTLSLKGSLYADDGKSGALNLNNSNIYNVNSIYFADLCNSAQEGIHFCRTSTTVDSLWALNGVLRWSPNRPLGETVGPYSFIVMHSNNYTDYTVKKDHNHDSRYLTLGGGTMTGTLHITPQDWGREGGQIDLCASKDRPDLAGTILDNYEGVFRIFGIGSADGKTTVGAGTPLTVNPYTRRVEGGYTFGGNLTGTAGAANKLSTARAIKIGSTSRNFDGTANITWTLDDMGAPLNHVEIRNTDFNTITTSGFYRLHNGNTNNKTKWANGGSDWGQMLVMHSAGDTIAQIYIQHSGTGVMAYRGGNPPNVSGSGAWYDWHEVIDRPRFNPCKIQSSSPSDSDILWAW